MIYLNTVIILGFACIRPIAAPALINLPTEQSSVTEHHPHRVRLTERKRGGEGERVSSVDGGEREKRRERGGRDGEREGEHKLYKTKVVGRL